jgi:tRNA (cytidine/uridine-2'-O-)-methyltransferase
VPIGLPELTRQSARQSPPKLRLALYQPDRPHNFGSILRLCACLGVTFEVIEPCGFPLDDRRIRAGALDYAPMANWVRHRDFALFDMSRLANRRRLVLLSTAGSICITMWSTCRTIS